MSSMFRARMVYVKHVPGQNGICQACSGPEWCMSSMFRARMVYVKHVPGQNGIYEACYIVDIYHFGSGSSIINNNNNNNNGDERISRAPFRVKNAQYR